MRLRLPIPPVLLCVYFVYHRRVCFVLPPGAPFLPLPPTLLVFLASLLRASAARSRLAVLVVVSSYLLLPRGHRLWPSPPAVHSCYLMSLVLHALVLCSRPPARLLWSLWEVIAVAMSKKGVRFSVV